MPRSRPSKQVADTLHATSRMAEDFAKSLGEAARRLGRASSLEELKSLTNALLAAAAGRREPQAHQARRTFERLHP